MSTDIDESNSVILYYYHYIILYGTGRIPAHVLVGTSYLKRTRPTHDCPQFSEDQDRLRNTFICLKKHIYVIVRQEEYRDIKQELRMTEVTIHTGNYNKASHNTYR